MSVSAENNRLRRIRRTRLSLLNSWYGDEFAAVEIAAHISHPRSLQNGIRAVMAHLEAPEARALRELRKRWPEIAGPAISRLATPSEWNDGLLTLEVRHNALMRELKPSLEPLMEAVNRFSDGLCTEIRLTISGGGAKR